MKAFFQKLADPNRKMPWVKRHRLVLPDHLVIRQTSIEPVDQITHRNAIQTLQVYTYDFLVEVEDWCNDNNIETFLVHRVRNMKTSEYQYITEFDTEQDRLMFKLKWL